MALRVWLPLDGDLRNLGCSNVTVTNNGATVNANGKIGSCYAFNGSTGYIALSGHDIFKIFTGGAQQFSVTVWVFHADATRAILFGDYSTAGGIGFNIELSTGHAVRFYWNGSPDTYPSNATIAASTWSHIALTYDGTKIQSYINGIAKGSWAGTLAVKNKTSGEFRLGRDNRSDSTAFNGRMNDFRIYDHCLSAAEVKEISQGLVLHYKLDGFMGGTNSNLAQGSKNLVITSATTNCNISKRGAAVLETRTDDFAQVKGTAAWQGFSLWSDSLNLKVGTTYTYSFYGYTALSASTNAGISFYPMMYNSAGTRDTSSKMPISVMGGTFTNVNSKQIEQLSTTPQLYWVTFTWNQTMADILANGGKIELSIQIHGTFNTDRTDYLWAPKLEVGEKPTGWTPSIEEMGIDTTIVEDSSGYGHNGEIISELHTSNDTARYNSSTLFDGVDDCIVVPYNTVCPENIFTINLWFKKDAIGTKSYETLFGGPSGFEMDTRAGGTTSLSLYMASTRSGNRNSVTSLSLGNWYMVTMTRDGTKEKYYINGIFQSEIDAKAMPTGVYYIGAWASSTKQNYYGNISDFRIYCTPLLDTDIKQLYNVGMKVDNLGGVHSFELEENGSRELIAGRPLSSPFGIRNEDRDWYNGYVNGEIYLNSNMTSVGTGYIPVFPTGKTYYYDIDYSVNAGNQLYIQVERYDANKTTRTNQGAITILSTKPSSDVSHKHIFGTVDLSTDTVNPCAFICLRILNGWYGTESGVTGISTIHNISIKEVSSFQNPKVHKNGILLLDELKEYQKASFYKNGYIEASTFIEM